MTYYKVWKAWAAQNHNDIFYKILVLIGIVDSISFDMWKNIYNVD